VVNSEDKFGFITKRKFDEINKLHSIPKAFEIGVNWKQFNLYLISSNHSLSKPAVFESVPQQNNQHKVSEEDKLFQPKESRSECKFPKC
jgi:hypothetical protein